MSFRLVFIGVLTFILGVIVGYCIGYATSTQKALMIAQKESLFEEVYSNALFMLKS